MAKRLISLRIQEISGVDRPANKRKFLIVKTAKIDKQMTVEKEGDKFCLYDGDKKVGEYDSMEAAQAAKAKMGKGAPMLTKEQIAKIKDGEIQEAVVAQMEEMEGLEKKLKDKDAEIAKLKAGGEGETDEEKLWKGVHPAIRNRYESMKKQADDSDKLAKKEKDERETDRWIGKLKVFTYLPVGDGFAAVMKNIAEKCPDDVGEVERVLGSAQEIIAKGDILFKEIGKSGNGAGDATDIVARCTQAAQEYSKRDPKLTVDESLSKVFRDHPEWHKAYKKATEIHV